MSLKMSQSCTVPMCFNRHTRQKTGQRKLHFFRYPLKYPERVRIWLSAIGREDFHPDNRHKICSDHFKQQDYTQTSLHKSRVKLSKTAVPSIFLTHNQQNIFGITKLDIIQKCVPATYHKPIKNVTPCSLPVVPSTDLEETMIIPSTSNINTNSVASNSGSRILFVPSININSNLLQSECTYILVPLEHTVTSGTNPSIDTYSYQQKAECKSIAVPSEHKVTIGTNPINNLKDLLEELKEEELQENLLENPL